MTASKPAIASALIIITGTLCFFGYNNSYFSTEYYSLNLARESGGTLDGHWYVPGDYGCFEKKTVFRFEGNKIRMINAGKVIDQGMYFSSKNGKPFFVIKGQESKVFRYYFEDMGTHLFIENMEILNGGESLMVEEQRQFFTRCENPTTMGIFISLFQKVFDPAAGK